MTRGAPAARFPATNFVWCWAALTVAKLVLAACLPLFGDEAFYWQEGMHPALAYSDLPGLTAWLARLGVEVAGTHPLGLRWPFLLLGAAVPWLVVRIARREWGADAGWRAGGLALGFPLAAWLGVLALPDAPLVLACLLALDASLALLRRVGPVALATLLAALVAGALTHYRFAPAVLAGGLGLLMAPRGRGLLRHPAVWGVLALGAAAWLPIALWNQAHAGAGVQFQLLERHPWSFHASGATWPAVQAVAVTPGLFVLALATMRALAAGRREAGNDAGAVVFGIGLVSVLGYFALAFFADTERVSFHWPLAGWLAVLCAAPAVFDTWPRWARRATVVFAVAGNAVMLAALVAYSTPAARAALADTRVYPDNFAGWSELAAAVREARAPLPPGTRVVADNFMAGAQLGFALGDPDLPVLDHPLNHKHGRAAQLQVWGLERAGRADLGDGPVLLVVEDTARPYKARLEAYHELCDRLGALPSPRVLDVDHGRKRFLLYPMPDGLRDGACVAPAMAWIDAPARDARVRGQVAVQGWAFKDGAGIARVEVTLDGESRAVATYGRAMANVASYWERSTDPAHPRVGFDAMLDLRGVAPGTHWLGLRLHGRDGSVEAWPEQRLEVE
jgi:4-amino-4-deoxy-L-arabinose transferase-like glycosyltransferase